MQNISKPVEGPNLRLRLIDPNDAAYVCGLRTDPALSQHLSAVAGTVQDQRCWIENYKEREARGDEFYFIIERHDGMPCGTVRIYDVTGESFTWGSWILDVNKTRKAALESAVLIYQVGFASLDRVCAVFEVLNENAHTLAFHRRFGARETGRDELSTYFEYTRAQFETDQPAYLKMLGNE